MSIIFRSVILTGDRTIKSEPLNNFSFSVVYHIILGTSNLFYGKILQSYGLHISLHLKYRLPTDFEYHSSFHSNSKLL
jgi:hypothetical protein